MARTPPIVVHEFDRDTGRTSLPSLPPPVTRFARYDVVGRLAVGGMAEIYLARETIEGGGFRHLALKVLRRQKRSQADDAYFEEMFLREGRTALQLVHPSICHVHEFGKWGGHYFIAMEWIDGVSLSHLLSTAKSDKQPVAPALAASIAAQVAAALDYAHHARDARGKRLRVVHRDVNPQNIMIRHDGVVKLLDFGVAEVAGAEGEDSRADTVKGKFGYIAPEYALQRPIDGRADVFALGVCLFEMLTGTRLYKRDTPRETVLAVINEAPPALRDVVANVPEALDSIVQRALAKKPDDRFRSAGAMQAALESFLANAGEVVSSRRLAGLMQALYPEQHDRAPSLYTGPLVAERLAALEDHDPRSTSLQPVEIEIEPSPAPSAKRGRRVLMVLALALLGASLAVWALWPKREIGSEARVAPPAASNESGSTATPPPEPASPIPPTAAAPMPTEPAPSGPEQVTVQGNPELVPESDDEPAPSSPVEPAPKPRRPTPVFVADPGF